MASSRLPSLALLLLLGCAGEPAAREPVPPALVGGEAEAEVLEKWGAPSRKIEVHDAVTGRDRTVWQYDRYADAGSRRLRGARETVSITFEQGKVAKVERKPVPRSVDSPSWPGAPGAPQDSAARRDME